MNENVNNVKEYPMRELLEFLKENAPYFYQFTLVTTSIPVTVLTNVLDSSMKTDYSSGITISSDKRICMITIKDGETVRDLIADKKLYTINDTKKTYTAAELTIEELRLAAARLQRAFTVSNYDLSKIKVFPSDERRGGAVMNIEAIDDGKNFCKVYADKFSGRVKYIETGERMCEVVRYDNKPMQPLLMLPPAGYKKLA